MSPQYYGIQKQVTDYLTLSFFTFSEHLISYWLFLLSIQEIKYKIVKISTQFLDYSQMLTNLKLNFNVKIVDRFKKRLLIFERPNFLLSIYQYGMIHLISWWIRWKQHIPWTHYLPCLLIHQLITCGRLNFFFNYQIFRIYSCQCLYAHEMIWSIIPTVLDLAMSKSCQM